MGAGAAELAGPRHTGAQGRVRQHSYLIDAAGSVHTVVRNVRAPPAGGLWMWRMSGGSFGGSGARAVGGNIKRVGWSGIRVAVLRWRVSWRQQGYIWCRTADARPK